MVNHSQFILILNGYQSITQASIMLIFQNMTFKNNVVRELIISEENFVDNIIVLLQSYYMDEVLKNSRSVWMKGRSQEWWDKIVPQFEDSDWIENFRMSKETFHYICAELDPILRPRFNPLMPRKPLSTEKQVGIAIFSYASCCEYRVLGHLFGVHKSTIWKCMQRVTRAINVILLPKWITLPNEEECKQISEQFEKKTGMPRFIGAIDGSHIPITPPSEGYRDFINRKGYGSYVLQGLVDAQLRFRNINIESPGCNHDANVFKQSALFKHYAELICQHTEVIDGIEIHFLIMGDPAYPLLPWLIKGFTKHHILTPLEESFNAYLNSGRVVVEIAFGRLKARWRRINKRLDCHYTFVPDIVSACCVLHNIVEEHKDTYNKKWEQDVRNARLLFPEPSGEDDPEREMQLAVPLNVTEKAKVIRNVLLNVIKNLPLRKTFR